MESSEEEDDFPSHEWITPQSHINSVYQSHTEKGIRKLCSELLDLKEAVENLSGNMHSKYLSFLRISEEVIEVEQELIQLQKHVSSQGILVQDLINGVCHELEEWNKVSSESLSEDEDFDVQGLLNEMEDPKLKCLETIDVLLAEHKIDEAVLAIEKEEEKYPELKESQDSLLTDDSSYKVAFSERKAKLVCQLVEISEQQLMSIGELKKALSGLIKLGKGPLAHQLLLKAYTFLIRRKLEAILPSCSIYSETSTAMLSQIVFSNISLATKESQLIFGDSATYSIRIQKWAEFEIESFVRLVKENAPIPDTASALRSASVCLQASVSHCSFLKSQGLDFSNLLMILVRPYFEEVLDLNFNRARQRVLDLSGFDDATSLSPQLCIPLSAAATSNFILTNSGNKFMSIVVDILDQLSPMTVVHFGGIILKHLSLLFDKYVESLKRAVPGPSEDDIFTEQKEGAEFRVETDAQQLALLGTAITVADELLPVAVSRILTPQTESQESENTLSGGLGPAPISTVVFREWRRDMQRSVDNLRDHFCRQYILTFVYSREGNTRMDAHMYLDGKREDIESHPLPSWPFQALFGRLQQLASVAGDVLLGKEKMQKILLARLTEVFVIWLLNEQEFWDVFEDDSTQLQPFGLQQLILDMHFIVEIVEIGGCPSRSVQQTVSDIIARAVRAFSKKGVDPQSVLPEDEWFVGTAKAAISKLMPGSGSEASEVDDGHIVMHDDVSESDEDPSSPLTEGSVDSFVSANNGEADSPVYFTDPEA